MSFFFAAVNRCATQRQGQDRLCGASLSLGDGNCLVVNGHYLYLRGEGTATNGGVDGIEDIQAINIGHATDRNWIAEI